MWILNINHIIAHYMFSEVVNKENKESDIRSFKSVLETLLHRKNSKYNQWKMWMKDELWRLKVNSFPLIISIVRLKNVSV